MIDDHLLRANDAGIRLEIIGGLPLWTPAPSYKHHKAIDRIRASITPTEACVHTSNVYVQFPDGSLTRPDIALFSHEPDEEDDAIHLVPEAVVDIVSRGYEARDILIAPWFYLAQGVKDVIVFNLYSLAIRHLRRDGVHHLVSPAEIVLECGCRCTV